MSAADYLRPIEIATRSTFVTARAAARHMVRQGSGVVLFFGGDGDPVRDYSIGGFQVALCAAEAMRRQLSTELGKHGVRAVTLRTGGVPETIPAGTPGAEEITAGITASTLLGRTATLADVGNVAAFVASDLARTMTAATVNVSAGALVD
jgi:3-oxoacyl-[acyl-carrier protein] reductase